MATDTATPSAGLYELLHERALIPSDGLPSPETLAEIESALAGVDEFLVDPLFRAVLSILLEGKANSITADDIGRLVIAADHIADQAGQIVRTAASINVAAREAYELAKGYDGECLVFTEYGAVADRERFDYVLRGRFDGV